MRYKARRKISFIVGLMIAVFNLVNLGVAALVYFTNEPFAWIVFGIWSFATVSLTLQSFAWYTYYAIHPNSVTLQGVYNKKDIPIDEIESCRVLSEEEVSEFVGFMASDREYQGADGNMSEWWNATQALHELTKYRTVEFVHKTTTVNHATNVTNVKTSTSGDFVLLSLTSGQKYVISPSDEHAFCEDLNRKLSHSEKNQIKSS